MSLTLIIGPMMAGKTFELVKRASAFNSITNKKALFILPTLDTRDLDKYISSHFNFFSSLENIFDVIRIDSLENVNVENYEMICIDECQFFKDIYNVVKSWLFSMKNILVSGLSSDYKMRNFGEITDLISLTNEIVHLKAKCKKCYQETQTFSPACYTKRFDSENTNLILIGNGDEYESVCLKHYIN